MFQKQGVILTYTEELYDNPIIIISMKFAYLIMSHNSLDLLKELIKALDFPGNDIFIHLDSKLGEIDLITFCSMTKYSKVVFLSDRISVEWGKYTQIQVVLNLIRKALPGQYDYYHFLSGVDFPIKGNRYIQHFFTENNGKELIQISPYYDEKEISYRVSYRHIINGNLMNKYMLMKKLNSLLVHIQKLFHIVCVPSVKGFLGGSAWFSITHTFATDLLQCREEILKLYRYSFIPDEIYLQTFANSHHYIDKIYKEGDIFSNCRKIDFKRGNHHGNPYVWQAEDFDELMNSSDLWARKFSENDMSLIRKIAETIKDK